jgi:hypothetical protein
LQPADSARQVTNLPPRALDPEEEADIKAALDKLTPADRTLALQQRFCPIQGDTRLGEMGKPVKLILDGRPMFLCCKNCVKEARANAARTLRKVEQLRTRYGPVTPRKGGRP